ITSAEWADAMAKGRAPLGAVVQRAVAETAFDKAKSDNGAEFEVALVRYRTSFAKKVDISETITLEHDPNGVWRVIGYLIRRQSPRFVRVAEPVALSKFACPSCGGEAVWTPAKQKLVCPFCGTESPAKVDAAGAIVEDDLGTALRGSGDGARGWQAERRQVKCQSCNAISVLDPARQAPNCEFCGSGELVPYGGREAG